MRGSCHFNRPLNVEIGVEYGTFFFSFQLQLKSDLKEIALYLKVPQQKQQKSFDI